MRMAQLAEEAVLAQRMVLEQPEPRAQTELQARLVQMVQELVGRLVLLVEGLAQAQLVQLGQHRLVGLAEVLQR